MASACCFGVLALYPRFFVKIRLQESTAGQNVSRESSLVEQEVVGLVREKIGPVAAFKTAICVKRLPKTRSGKILRGTMQKIADREDWKMPATIDDPATLDEIAEVLSGRRNG